MTQLMLGSLQAAGALALSVFALRALPTLVAFFVMPEPSTRDKVLALAAYTIGVGCAIRFAKFDTRDLLMAYTYLCVASTLPYLANLRSSRGANFALAFGVFLVLPALCFQQRSVLLLLGWELALSAYSYARDVPLAERNVANYWFFVFVHPTVVYPQRGTRVAAPALSKPGLWCVLRGLGALGVSGALMIVSAGFEDHALVPWGKLPTILARVVAVYAAHWGLASLQLGLMRQLGYAVPERYLRPYLASSPRDFWLRWNTYLGSWVRVYVFQPLTQLFSSRLRAMDRRRRRVLARALAVFTSFVFVGALHDAYAGLLTHRVAVSATLWFAANALVLLAWEAAARATLAQHPMRFGRWASTTALLGLAIGLAIVLP